MSTPLKSGGGEQLVSEFVCCMARGSCWKVQSRVLMEWEGWAEHYYGVGHSPGRVLYWDMAEGYR